MVVRAWGYRPRSIGRHYNTFLALEAAEPRFAALSAYFDGCRTQRNISEQTGAGTVTETEAEDLLNAVRQFAVDAEEWIKGHYPQFV